MATLEEKLKTPKFWLKLGVINHCVALAVIAFGCVYSGFTCDGKLMREVLSVYAFTLLTPQIALEAILLVGVFLVSHSFRVLQESLLSLLLFIATFTLLILFIYLQ